MRRWLLPILAVALTWTVFAHRAELLEVLRTLARGRWEWVTLAALLQAVYYVTFAQLYRLAFERVGVRARLGDTLPVLIGSLCVNVLVPSAGVAGAALFVDDAARRGQSPGRAAAGIALTRTADFAALSLLLVVSLVYWSQAREPRFAELAGAAALVVITLAMAALLLFGLGRPRWLRGGLAAAWAATAAASGRLGRPSPLPADWPERTAGEIAAASEALRAHPRALVTLPAVAVLMHLLDAASLGALCVAFHQAVEPGAMLAGYSFGILAWVLSPVPQGIGVVEAVIALVYASLGVPGEAATAIALAFRGLTFWLPMAAGFLLLRHLRSLRAVNP